jgi:hypothetical protein
MVKYSADDLKPSVTRNDFINEAKMIFEVLKESNEKEEQASYFVNNDFEIKDIYLISTDWFSNWKAKTSFELLQSDIDIQPSNIKMEIELSFLNKDLVDTENQKKFLRVSELLPNLSFLDVPLRADLVEEVHFLYVNQDLWKIIKAKYPDSLEVKRRSYTMNSQKYYEIHLPVVFYL